MKYGNVESHGLDGTAAAPPPATAVEIASIHIPAPSLFPILIALGIFSMGIGMLIAWYRMILIGAALMAFCVLSMAFEYPHWGEEDEHAVVLSKEGYDSRFDELAALSPYQTRYIKRFGNYEIDLSAVPALIADDLTFALEPPPSVEVIEVPQGS